MSLLESYFQRIKPLHTPSMEMAQARWNSIAKPLHSLGLLEENVIQMAGIFGSHQVEISNRCVTVLCADNGVVEEGVTQVGSEITAKVAENLTKGQTSVNAMARLANATVLPVDIGMKQDVNISGLLQKKISYGTHNIAKGPAMSRQQAMEAILTGIHLVQTLQENGCHIIATGEMGIGNTTTSSAMASVFLQQPPEMVTGKGAGLSGEGLERKIQVIHRALAQNQPNPADPLDVLSKVGGYDIAGLTGIFLGGGIYRIPVLMDGLISSIAALTAVRLCPAVKEYLLASHVSKEPAGKQVLNVLQKKPMLTCDFCLGEGTGAVAALPILDMALEVYHSMSTFSDIQMKPYQPLE